MFLDFERSCSASTVQGVSRSNRTRSAGAPFARRPAGRPSSFAGLAVSAREQRGEIDVLVVIEAQRGGEQGLEADGAVGGLGEGPALRVGVLRIVSGDDHVDIAAGDTLDHGPAVVLGAQRRRSLKKVR